jgi:Ca-activated chloride channel family protein
MRFLHPQLLFLLIITPITYALFLYLHRRRYKQIEKLGNLNTLDRFSQKSIAGKIKREGLFVCLSLLFFILALSQPQAGTRLEPISITGSDVYIGIDLSQSMQAEDVSSSRLERARIDALDLIRSFSGDRAGLILFAGDAFVQCPLTIDYNALSDILNAISTQTAVESGTDLSAPLKVAMKSLKPKEDTYAVLVLLTDGEETAGNLDKTLRELRKRGIKVFPVYDENGTRTGYKKDRNGKVVISSLDEALLKSIADTTGGYYFRAEKSFNEISKLLSALETMKKREIETKKYTVYEERFQIPLALGILFLLLYIFTRIHTRKKTV